MGSSPRLSPVDFRRLAACGELMLFLAAHRGEDHGLVG